VQGGSLTETHQPRFYTGALCHPSFGSDEHPVEITLYAGAARGHWKAMEQVEEVVVKNEGKNVKISDKGGTTVLDGSEVIGGMLVGIVVQNGIAGGRFWLLPSSKRTTFLKTTSLHRHMQITQLPVWRSVGMPVKMTLQPKGDAAWCTNFRAAFS